MLKDSIGKKDIQEVKRIETGLTHIKSKTVRLIVAGMVYRDSRSLDLGV